MSAPQITEVGPLVLFPTTRKTLLHGREVELTGQEFGLLLVLAQEPTRAHTKDELIGLLRLLRVEGPRTLDSVACRLRRKLSERPEHGDVRLVVNVWGVGYRLMDSKEAC